jgi:CheY-like chemotaxis protein
VAVTEGDLTRQVGVEASGEVAVLKDKLNEMIRNLRETTRQNTEQDWLKTNLERFTRMLQGQRDLATVSSMILSELAPLLSAQHGVFYTLGSLDGAGSEQVLRYQAGYGYKERKHLSTQFRLGEGLVGQCAQEKERILLTDVPGDYVRINSGLGESSPLNIIVLPILFEGSVRAVVELASFSRFSATHQAFLDQLTESIGLVLNTIEANTLTETLLKQAQSQAQELTSRQEDLRSSNEDLERQAKLLAQRNTEAEQKNEEVQQSKLQVEEKAGQLAVSSKYKSEFIANMSHELRTPLNSLLILAEQLHDNHEHTMSDTQVEYAGVILDSGRDLLNLLNSTLELAMVESGTATVELAEVSLEKGLKATTAQIARSTNGAPVPSVNPPRADGPSAVGLVTAAPSTVADEAVLTPTTPGRSARADHPLEGTKVLVVDDDFRNVFALTALLERVDAEVLSAESGVDALVALECNAGINLILMDIMMPGMDGYEAMRAIRAREKFADIPIIAVTGKVIPGERGRCLAAGANDYVPKPVDTTELMAAIEPWVRSAARLS